jgi:uncharacterized membrane protein
MIALIVIVFILAAVVQTWGAYLERRPCKYIKYSYAVSLFISAGFMILYWLDICWTHTTLHASLVLLGLTILIGGTARLFELYRHRKECPLL